MQLYLSKLILNPRSRRVLRELASPYELHRTILRAFPDRDQGGPGRVLFRLEPFRQAAGSPVILVQSEVEPNWAPVDEVGGYLLAHEHKKFDPTPGEGRPLRFRLRANPTVRRRGSRHGLYRLEEQLAWLGRKAKAGGFEIAEASVAGSGIQVTRKPGRGRPAQVHFAVDFEGHLRVSGTDRFAETVAAGVGPAKAYGFGLLSVAPAPPR